MEPKLPTPSSLPEIPAVEQKFVAPERLHFNDELAPERPAAQEHASNSQHADPGAVVAQAVATATAATVTDPVTTQSGVSDTPLVASDDDLIEKVWVDKAKNIVAQTKNDPYQQELEISKLQADYLMKRYGKQVKLSSE